MALRIHAWLPLTLALLVGASGAALADPPSHAPAHGYRGKQERKVAEPEVHTPKGGVEVVYDSERGIAVAVGLPGIFFHDGRYYREHDGHWQFSLSGDGDWKLVADLVPEVVVRAGGKKR